MDISEFFPQILTIATTIAAAFVATKTSVAKCEAIITEVKEEVKSLKSEINKIYDLDKRLSLIELKMNKEDRGE